MEWHGAHRANTCSPLAASCAKAVLAEAAINAAVIIVLVIAEFLAASPARTQPPFKRARCSMSTAANSPL
jgi:hypothetical protein